MSAITTAVIAGIATAGGAVASAKIGSNAAKNAAKTQSDAADKALAVQREQYQQQRQDFSPYQQQGAQAMGRMTAMSQAPRQTFDPRQQQGQPSMPQQPPQMANLGNPQGMPPQGPQMPPGWPQGAPRQGGISGFMGRVGDMMTGGQPNPGGMPPAGQMQTGGQMGQAVQQAPGGGPMPGALVRVMAPNGQEASLPADMAQRAVAKGATIIQ